MDKLIGKYALGIVDGKKVGGYVRGADILDNGLLDLEMTTDILDASLFESIEKADKIGTTLEKAINAKLAIVRITEKYIKERY